MGRILVGMSGGVDSSVAAALLLEQGHEVIGATMLVWSPPGVEMNHPGSCCGLEAADDARRVCDRLGIRHYTLDFREEFYREIVEPYVEDYLSGRTPNPCVRCNQFLKFRSLAERARSLGADRIATGHYARIRWDERRCRWLLLQAQERVRDQSYALYGLGQEQLAATLFPLGDWTKADVRGKAAELNLATAGKPDSQETCFVPNNNYPELLKILVPDRIQPGPILDPKGERLGTHTGTPHYTVGQRRRINVGSPAPLYVSRILPESNAIVVAPVDHPDLFRNEVTAVGVNWVSRPGMPDGSDTLRVAARVRYNGAAHDGELRVLENGALRVTFDRPVRAITPGQSLVCYEGDEVVGGGVIKG